MKSRERLLIAVDGGEPDRLPRALGFYRVEVEKLAPQGQWRDELVDVRFIRVSPSPQEEELDRRVEPFPTDTRLGTPAQLATYGRWSYRPEASESRNPLAAAKSLEDLKNFSFPQPERPRDVEGLISQVRDLHSRDLAAGGNLPHLGGELFESAWRLRGLNNFLIDLIRRPEWADFLLDRLAAFGRRNAEALAESGIDVLALDDDVGMPGTMMISPDTWRKFFKGRLADIIAAARNVRHDLRILFHSDGYFEPIIEDLVEIGVDAINPIQPDHMDAVRIRKKFGPKPALWGTVGRHTTFSLSTPDGIRREVKERIETLGRAGLVLSPAYDIDEPDIPWANIAAFLDAARSYG
jgi:uroporphyrinogen decarboxylase